MGFLCNKLLVIELLYKNVDTIYICYVDTHVLVFLNIFHYKLNVSMLDVVSFEGRYIY